MDIYPLYWTSHFVFATLIMHPRALAISLSLSLSPFQVMARPTEDVAILNQDPLWTQTHTLQEECFECSSCLFGVVMDGIPNDALILILGYGGVSLYGRVNTLNIAFKIATGDCGTSDWIVWAVLEHPLDPCAVCTLLNYGVNYFRVERLVGIALNPDGMSSLMNEGEFRKLVVLQLALEHLRASRPFPHTVTGQDIFELLLHSVSRRLTPDHSISVRVLQSLTLQSDLFEHPLAFDVSDRISGMQTWWRSSTMGVLCILTVFMVLYNDTWIHLGSGARVDRKHTSDKRAAICCQL